MKRRFVQIDGELREVVDGYIAEPRSSGVMPDIQPYQSMIDGSMITSRSQHRDHLRQHGCSEIGNEVKHLMKQTGLPDVSPQKRKELIVAKVQSMSERQFKQALKRDIDFVKWNSRGTKH